MAIQGTLSDVRRSSSSGRGRPGRSLVIGTTDRARAFATARRHTAFVRICRFALPLAAAAAVASYGLGVRVNLKLGNGTLQTGPVTLSTEDLSMANPRYEGFNKDGSKFLVTAKSATHDIRAQGPVRLDQIDGRMVQSNNGIVTLTAPRGLFDNAANQLELLDDIKVRSDDGMRADLTQATIFLKDNRIVSTQPVAIEMKAGQIRANQMELLQSQKQATFSDGVMTRLKPEPKPPGTPAKPQATPAANAPRMIGATDAPIDIASQTLMVDDAKKVAIFTGNVVAKQGDASLQTPELQAFYDGAPVALPGAEAAATANETGQPGGKLKRLLVKSDVTMTTATDRVTSDSADFDAEQETAVLLGHVVMNSGVDRRATSDRVDLDSKSDTALMTGNVVVNQDKNILRGARLYVDRRGGITKLWSPADGGQPAGRIAARFFQSATPATQTKTAVKKVAEPVANQAGGFVFRTDSTAPIDIDADVLDVADKVKTATFRGAVHAVQGDFTIRTPELVATYSGEAGLTTGGDTKAAPAQLTKIRANQKVEVTSSNDQSATGDWAEFDTKADTVTIGGNVMLKKGGSVALGPKAVIDMTTGITVMENSVKHAGPAVSPSPTEQRAPYTLPDLPAVKAPVVAPVAPAFGTDPKACAPGRTCLKVEPKDAAQASSKPEKKAPAGGAWQPEVAPPVKQQAPAAATSGWTSTAQPPN
jgi:LPS export ABC transporter protein LptC/lipopolysaccharide transport protein LptA